MLQLHGASPQTPVHAAPDFGKVAQEGHPNSAELKLQRLHFHEAFKFPSDHKWKAVERDTCVKSKESRSVHGWPPPVYSQSGPSLHLVCT